MLDTVWRRFVSKNVSVSVDSTLSPSIIQHSQNINLRNQPIDIPIRLFKLALAIGTISSVRVPPITKRNKIIDGLAFVERIVLHNGNDFRIIIDHEDDDRQIEISQKIGEGISVVVADNLYKLNWSTLSKIRRKGRQSKPDIECNSHLNRSIVWEAKGSINPFYRGDKNRAIRQKRRVFANIRFASFSQLEEDQITTVEILDPPSFIPDNQNQKKILLKADHYAKVFNLIGQKKLSKYFNLMRKRIIYDRNFPEFDEKVDLYNEIKKNYIKIEKINRSFLGNIEQVDDNEYVFIGVDENLISLNGFIEFNDYPEDVFLEEGENNFTIMRDGICFAKLKDISFILDQLKGKIIQHYQETISIRDIDTMNHVALADFFLYLFKKIDVKILREVKFKGKDFEKGYILDYIIEHKGKKFIVEFKHRVDRFVINQLKEYEQYIKKIEPSNRYKFILITPGELDESIANYLKRSTIKIIGRADLKRILRKFDRLEEFLS